MNQFWFPASWYFYSKASLEDAWSKNNLCLLTLGPFCSFTVDILFFISSDDFFAYSSSDADKFGVEDDIFFFLFKMNDFSIDVIRKGMWMFHALLLAFWRATFWQGLQRAFSTSRAISNTLGETWIEVKVQTRQNTSQIIWKQGEACTIFLMVIFMGLFILTPISRLSIESTKWRKGKFLGFFKSPDDKKVWNKSMKDLKMC